MMKSSLNDSKYPDSEAGDPCPSLFGEDSGSNRDIIAGWQKDVSNQASPSNVTDFELLENLNVLSTVVTTFWHTVPLNKRIFVGLFCFQRLLMNRVPSMDCGVNLRNKRIFSIVTICLKIVVSTLCWRSILLNKRIFSILKICLKVAVATSCRRKILLNKRIFSILKICLKVAVATSCWRKILLNKRMFSILIICLKIADATSRRRLITNIYTPDFYNRSALTNFNFFTLK